MCPIPWLEVPGCVAPQVAGSLGCCCSWGLRGLTKASEELLGSVQILFVGTPVTSMVAVGWRREEGCRLLHFVTLHLRHSVSVLSLICS